MKNPRVIMADDHSLILAGLRKLVEEECEVVGTVEDGRALIEAAQKGGVTAYTYDSSGRMIKLSPEDTVKEIKPDPEPFLKAIELSECAPEECVYVGDSPTKDMRPAKEVGMMTVLVKKNPSEKDMMHADAVISSVKDIITLL